MQKVLNIFLTDRGVVEMKYERAILWSEVFKRLFWEFKAIVSMENLFYSLIMEILTKSTIFYPKLWTEFWFSRLFVWAGWKKTLYLKKYHKNETHLRLLAHIFTKLSQNVCLINTHILMYWYTRSNCTLWKASWFCCIFLGIFIH